jgi:hypothetical protein
MHRQADRHGCVAGEQRVNDKRQIADAPRLDSPVQRDGCLKP